MVGPRGGKYNRDGSANAIPGHNIPLVGIGAMAMLVGWVPYVIGAALMHSPYVQSGDRFGTVAMNVLLAGAAGGIVSLAYGQVRYGKPEVILTLGGMLGGLVAISAGAAIVGSIAAVVIGAVAGLLVSAATLVLDVRWHVDDPSGGIAIHGVGGLWGTLAVGVFAPGTWTDRLELLAVQALGAAMVALLSAIVAIVAFAIMKMVVDLRSKEADEFDGLDLAEHDINAYPDFQQTMIKSYHLREA
jgi:Amt family ammonium transporter